MTAAKSTDKATNAAADAMVELISQSFRLNSRLLLTADRMARDVGLSAARWQVLSAIAQATEPPTISAIARLMGLTRQSVQQVADALAKDNLINFEPNPKHRRASLVVVTLKAMKLLKQLDEQRYAWAREVATTLPVTNIKVANKVLGKVREKL
ncbi:MAG: MarR family transcriptional regulator [Gammaproteobacteria bacterium]|nr:MarR family transcriptional regulator [Gammaproteobacteria bacterium]MCP4090770.1 MarR family transcriptional regulator [Gammaproteobacteria bacterium]MCP4277197.1 MarR family transcriptional regulator [Gammaproteobacteria bacterium]MCP4832819.1 MarR family transcriptional regulator [Gammaproteobacteria bacterium]MCP4927993.1 MarR family transcriptional regulator [Gammaproteobacteria bacterium]